MNTEPKDLPLTVAVENDQLVVRIGIDTLAHAAAHCERFYDYDQHDSPPYVKITDTLEFARGVLRQLEAEAEDGSSIISDALDDAIVEAHGDGSEGIDYGDDD